MHSEDDVARPGAAIDHARPDDTKTALPSGVILLFMVASGLAVANAYFAPPLLDVMARDMKMSPATAGLVVGATQVGYALGLVLLAPLGDLIDRRRLIIVQTAISALALLAVALAPNAGVLLAAMGAVGLLAVAAQAIVAHAATLAAPSQRGRVVGMVTSGIVIGILSARAVAGVLTDLAGWRAVYLVSAALTLAVAALAWRLLPRVAQPRAALTYPRLIASTFRLIAEEPVLRTRGVIALLIFANVTTLLTPLALELSGPPHDLSHTGIGFFGLAGVAGALAASRAGRWVDAGHGQRTTGAALALVLAAWIAAAGLDSSLLWLILGVVILDFSLQAVHVSNQGLIYRVRPEAQSRLTAAYMIFYSIGSATGASLSPLVHARAGWTGVCLLGAGISLITLAFWAATARTPPRARATSPEGSASPGLRANGG